MSDLYLHSRLAEEVLKQLDKDVNESILYIGAQGPDPFFYKQSKETGMIASVMHDVKTRDMFVNMTNLVRDNFNKDTYAFLVGFICHYNLDVFTHPYIFYYTGNYSEDDESTNLYRGLHKKFELSMDAMLIEKEHNIKANQYKLKKYFPDFNALESIYELIDKTNQLTYDITASGDLYKSGLKTFRFVANKLLPDRFGFKKLFLRFVDKIKKPSNLFYSDLSFYNHIENFDFLNNERRTYFHPVTNESYNFSVMDLFKKAKEKTLMMIKQIDDFLDGKWNIDLNEVFDNLSFSTGLNVDDPREMKHFENYRDLIKD